MKFVDPLVKFSLRSRLTDIQYYLQHPMQPQKAIFKSLINKSMHTLWGKKWNFQSIRNIRDFQQNVPLSEYDTLKPYIERMMRGERDILWPGKISYFSKSSGTTSDKSKFIPVSDENLQTCHIQGGRDTIALWYHYHPDQLLFRDAKAIIMGGSFQEYEEFPNAKIGDVSAIMMNNMPFYVKWFQTPNLKTALLPKWEEKIEQIARAAIRENITNISGVPTWTLVLFRRILELTGKDNILEVFPNFRLYMHGGVSFLPYKEQFKQLLPSDQVQYREIYNASEGFFATQHMKGDEDMLLLLDNGIFYEFIPLEHLNQPNARAYTIEEVELNKDYAIVISNNAGLWRYLIGDTIRFTSLFPHKIQITGRTKHFINAFGEEVMIGNTDQALAMTCAATNATVKEYTVAPIFMDIKGKGGHEWLIEFDTPPSNVAQFAALLDKNLQSVNTDYEAKRYLDMALLPLKLNIAPKGLFHKWLKRKGKYGGQNKVPRLSNSRKYLEELLGFVPEIQ